jgi:hypothetical protein
MTLRDFVQHRRPTSSLEGIRTAPFMPSVLRHFFGSIFFPLFTRFRPQLIMVYSLLFLHFSPFVDKLPSSGRT